jgi:neutral ceramidase
MRISRLMTVSLACLFSLLTLPTVPLGAADEQPLRAAVVKAGITPSDLFALSGSFKDVHDRIFARVLVLDDGVTTNTIMMTLVNDRVGDIADDAAYNTFFFEVNGTPSARGCAENGIVNGLLGMIHDYF